MNDLSKDNVVKIMYYPVSIILMFKLQKCIRYIYNEIFKRVLFCDF